MSPLVLQGVRCVKLDGGMTVAARDRVIEAFREDPFVTVFLISLKAGGVALNLTPACVSSYSSCLQAHHSLLLLRSQVAHIPHGLLVERSC